MVFARQVLSSTTVFLYHLLRSNTTNGNHVHFWCHALPLLWQIHFSLISTKPMRGWKDVLVGHPVILNTKQLWIFYRQVSFLIKLRHRLIESILSCTHELEPGSSDQLLFIFCNTRNTSLRSCLPRWGKILPHTICYFLLHLYFHLKLHFTRKGSFYGSENRTLTPQQLFLVNMYSPNVLENRGFTITKYWQKTTKPTQGQVHWINTPKQKKKERETGKLDTVLRQLTEIRKLKVWRLSFPYFNKKQGRIWRATDTKARYQFFCVSEKQFILWNHLKMCTSTCTKKGRSCLKNVLEFFSPHYWFGR